MKKIILIIFVIGIPLFAINFQHKVKEIKNCILFYDEGNNTINLKYTWYSHREFHGQKNYLRLEFQNDNSINFDDTPKQIDKIINAIVKCSK